MKRAASIPSRVPDVATANREPTVVRIELTLKSLLIVLALIAGVWLLLNLIPVLLVLVVALMIVGALNPVVAWLARRKVKRTFGVCLVFGLGAVLVVTLAAVTIPTLLEQAKTLARSEPRIREAVACFLERSNLTAMLGNELRHVQYADVVTSSGATLFAMSRRMAAALGYGVAAVFLAFYMMLDHDRLRGALFAVVPRRHHLRLSTILLNLGTIVGGYIRGQVLTCALMGGFILVLLLVCRVPNALALAAFGGLMDLLPYLGVFLTMAPAVLAAWMQGPVVAVVVFSFMLAYEELESRVLVPIVYGRALRLPPSVVFFSLIVGVTLAGVAGALLALPIAAAVLMLVEELRVELPGETVQPEDIEQRRKDDHTEREYHLRADSMPAAKAAVVATEISDARKKADVAAEKVEADLNPEATPPPFM